MAIELPDHLKVTADHIWQAACRALGQSYPIQNGPVLYPPMIKEDTMWYVAIHINSQITKALDALVQKFDNLNANSLGPFAVRAQPGQTYSDSDVMYIEAVYQAPGGYLTAKTQCSLHLFQPEPTS